MSNKSRWILALADGETVILQDNDDGWRVIWEGTPCTPSFNSQGAAEACLAMYRRGDRKPELPREAIGSEQPREQASARFKAMSGSTTLTVEPVGRRAVRILAPDEATERRALDLTETIVKILRCGFRIERTDQYITVTLLAETV